MTFYRLTLLSLSVISGGIVTFAAGCSPPAAATFDQPAETATDEGKDVVAAETVDAGAALPVAVVDGGKKKKKLDAGVDAATATATEDAAVDTDAEPEPPAPVDAGRDSGLGATCNTNVDCNTNYFCHAFDLGQFCTKPCNGDNDCPNDDCHDHVCRVK